MSERIEKEPPPEPSAVEVEKANEERRARAVDVMLRTLDAVPAARREVFARQLLLGIDAAERELLCAISIDSLTAERPLVGVIEDLATFAATRRAILGQIGAPRG